MKLEEKIEKQIRDAAYQAYLKLIKNGVPSAEAVKIVLRQYYDEIIYLLAAAFNDLGIGVISPKNMAKMKIGSVTLSEALYTHGKQTASAVSAVVRQEVKKADDVRKLALKLYEGYGFSKDDIKIEQKLPEYLLKDWNQVKAKKLKTPALKAAYLEAIDAKIKGETQGKINKKLKVAFEERNRYYANRIAQTELHRARMNQRAQELLDSGVEVVQVRMSASHPVYDVCDYHANLNAHGLGKGYYPIEAAPMPPFHPHCRCVLAPAFEKTKKNAKTPSPAMQRKLDDAFLSHLSLDERRRLLGSRAAVNEYGQGDKPILYFIDRFKPKDYRTTRIGQVSQFVMVPDLDNNELMSRKKVIAKPVEGLSDWKSLGVVSVTALREHALPAPEVVQKAGHEGQAVKLMREVLLLNTTRREVVTPIGQVVIDEAYLLHMVEKRVEARERYANFILPTLQDPLEVWEVDYTDGSKRFMFIGLFNGEKQLVVSVRPLREGGIALWNVISKSKVSKLNQQRIGRLLYKKWSNE